MALRITLSSVMSSLRFDWDFSIYAPQLTGIFVTPFNPYRTRHCYAPLWASPGTEAGQLDAGNGMVSVVSKKYSGLCAYLRGRVRVPHHWLRHLTVNPSLLNGDTCNGRLTTEHRYHAASCSAGRRRSKHTNHTWHFQAPWLAFREMSNQDRL